MTDVRTLGHPPAMALVLTHPDVAATAPLRVEDVYDAHADYVYRAARALGAPSASLDDVVQDVFIVVHRKLASFEGRSQLRTWLMGIVVRVVSDYRRTQRRKGTEPLVDEPTDARPSGPHERAERAEAARLLLEILDSLAEAQRTVFVLAEIEQMAAPEIAEALSVPLNTVYSRLRLARAQFEQGVQRVRARDQWRQR